MKQFVYILLILVTCVSVSSLSVPTIREVYTPDPIVLVIFDDPTNVSVTSYFLAQGLAAVFEENGTTEGQIPLKPFIKNGNTFTFEPEERLEEEDYTFKITAEDVFGNTGTFLSKFTIIELPFNVSIEDPSNSVASSKNFDIRINTFINATCVHSGVEADFDNSFPMNDNGNIHTISDYELLDENTDFPIFVKCKSIFNDLAAKTFLLRYDTTPPIIKSLSAPDTWNNKVVEIKKSATLVVETDEPSTCEYSQNNGPFISFGGNFSTTSSNKFVGLTDKTTHTFKVKCRNKADLVSDTKEISIEVDTGLGLGVDVQSPTAFMSSLSIPFIISTSRVAKCSLSEKANNFTIPMTPTDGTLHTHETLVAAGGNYSYKVYCEYGTSTGPEFIITDIPFIVDVTPPVITNVTDQKNTPSLTSLSAIVSAVDPESGVKEYYFAIGKLGLSTYDILNWTLSASSSLSAFSLSLVDGESYYFAVIASNGAGMNSTPSFSTGVLVNSSFTPSNVSDAEKIVDRTGCIVDDDRDGYGIGCLSGLDCNDKNPAGTLRNCNNGCVQDSDGDGFGLSCNNGRDCNDFNDAISFGCENKCRIDLDGDFYGPGCLNGPDCNDFSRDEIGICSDNTGCTHDLDCDGIDDAWELENGLNTDFDDSLSDPDGDGLTNLEEYRANSDPNSEGSSSSVQKPLSPKKDPEPEPKGPDIFIIIVVVLILILVGVGSYMAYSHYGPKKPSPSLS